MSNFPLSGYKYLFWDENLKKANFSHSSQLIVLLLWLSKQICPLTFLKRVLLALLVSAFIPTRRNMVEHSFIDYSLYKLWRRIHPPEFRTQNKKVGNSYPPGIVRVAFLTGEGKITKFSISCGVPPFVLLLLTKTKTANGEASYIHQSHRIHALILAPDSWVLFR